MPIGALGSRWLSIENETLDGFKKGEGLGVANGYAYHLNSTRVRRTAYSSYDSTRRVLMESAVSA